jgi:2,3-bisphosphoglycerate-dependent phosphoglycerate mutase
MLWSAWFHIGLNPLFLTSRLERQFLITAHGNSLRALVKHLEGITDEDIAALNIPTGIPLLYELDANFKPITAGGEYLDPEAARDAITAVANQGKK